MHFARHPLALVPVQIEVVDGKHRDAKSARLRKGGHLRGERGLAAALQAGDGEYRYGLWEGERGIQHGGNQRFVESWT
jgi:hypothetical protein